MGVLEDLHQAHLARRRRLSPEPAAARPPTGATSKPPQGPTAHDWPILEGAPPLEDVARADPLLPAWMRRLDGSLPQTPGDVIAAVARARGVTPAIIASRQRTRAIAHARQEAAYWIARLTSYPLAEIGRSMGGFDHTTILQAIRSHPERSGLPPLERRSS